MSDHPRRYVANGVGLHVLIGLTIEETREFECLERLDASFSGGTLERANPERWEQLYEKHKRAWLTWKTRMSSTAGG